MFKNFVRLAGMGLMGIVFLSGCATPPTPIPASYYQKKHEMTVKVVKCPAQAQMMDSGQGGLLGAAITAAARSGSMREQMKGIQGETVSELLRQKISAKLEDNFDVVDDKEQLATEIAVAQWGWFVPTTVLAIKTGSYQFRINGSVTVYDVTTQSRKRIAYIAAVADHPLGNEPTKADTQDALMKAADDFAEKAAQVILRNRPSQ
jgi:hypothetical protein